MTQIQIRRDTETNWTSVNPTLALGEWGYDTTNKVCKIGDGTTPWNTLPVYGGESELPIATETTAGVVKPDGSTITVTSDGTISATASGGTSDYTELTNKPQINSIELTGDVSLNSLSLYSQTETDNALGQKQDKLTTQSPLKISSVTTTNQTNCTYIDGTATALGTATGTGACYYYSSSNSMSTNGTNSTTDGVHINYPFSIASSAESALCYPSGYVFGCYNNDGDFVYLLNAGMTGQGGDYYHFYSIANSDTLVMNGSNKSTTNITKSNILSSATTWGYTRSIKIYCPDGLNIGNNLHITSLRLQNDNTFSTLYEFIIPLTSELITQLSKINVATYNISTNTEGETRTINPVRDASGNIVFNGDTGGSITSNTLQLEISSQANNILEVETDGLYVPSQSYTLPVATTSTLGGVKPDGTSITITDDGVISSTGSTPSNMVTTDTEQTISGSKTFASDVVISSTNNKLILGTSDTIQSAVDGLELSSTTGNIILNSSTEVVDDLVTTSGHRIANGSIDNEVRLGDSNALTTIYSNSDIKAVINGSTETTITTDLDLQAVNEELANTTDEVQALSTEFDTLKANVNNFKFWSGTQTAYNGIATKDPNTLYIITGE